MSKQERSHTFNVLMTAFGSPWEVSAITLPDENLHSTRAILSGVYVYGNDKKGIHPSVSCGDIILIGEERWLICRESFRLLTEDELSQYCRTARTSRTFSPLLNKPNLDEVEQRQRELATL
jgi:hypothetical protein